MPLRLCAALFLLTLVVCVRPHGAGAAGPVTPRKPVLAVQLIGNCPGPVSPGEHIAVSATVAYDAGPGRTVAWGIEAMTPALTAAPYVVPRRIRLERAVSGSGVLHLRRRLFLGRQDNSTWAGVTAHTFARAGATRAVYSKASTTPIGATIRLRVTDEAGRDIPFGATIENGGCLRSRGSTITTDAGVFAAFYHLEPASDAVVRVTSSGDGFEPKTVRIAAGSALLSPGSRRDLVVALAKPSPDRPHWSAEQLRTPLASGDTSRPVVYLTFDDGIGARATADVLQSAGARATFCLPGYLVEPDPSLVRYLVDRGHALCNHGYHHLNPTTIDDATLTSEIATTGAAIAAGGGDARPFFRPPEGSFDARTIEVAATLGYRTITWNVDPRDWACEVDAAGLAERVLSQVSWGSIVVMHSFGCATNAAIPAIVAGLRARGYSLETFNQLPSSK